VNFGSSFRRGWRSLRLGGRADGGTSTATFAEWARSTSPGREMCERSIWFDFFFAVAAREAALRNLAPRRSGCGGAFAQVRFVIFQGMECVFFS